MTKAQDKEQAEAKEYLRTLVKPGDTVYTILRHVSRSGMSRVIDPLVMTPDAGPYSIAGWAAKALGDKLDRDNWGVKVGGCGMDMGFSLIYNLSYTLFPNGFGCIGERCPSNDHPNGDRDYTPHSRGIHPSGPGEIDMGADHWHKDGGYALKHKWL